MSALLTAPQSPNLVQLHASLGLEDDALHDEVPAWLPVGGQHHLALRWFEPRRAWRAAALIAPATGVPQRFYAALARWMAARGYAVLTLDYAGLADSRAAMAEGASMRSWMLRDLPLALDAVQARARVAGVPVVWVGHSLGGHALPLQPSLAGVDAALCVGAQLPYFEHWPSAHQRWGARFFFRRYVPAWVRWTGRLPGVALGGGEDLPADAALDWSRWGQLPNYYLGDPDMAQRLCTRDWRGVAHFWCISDDWVFGPERAVQALVDAFASAPGRAEMRRLHPRDIGQRRVGHFAPFARHVGERLWPSWFDELEAAVPALRARR
ncbi:MAG: serine aminopeptidase domain-containing protein [Inhella sp.]|uniref:alpha/beta hydrolase family protein n=1 Tax=Inhella sp. TaxID=1921806 RepID=UPI00391F0E79